MKFRTCWLCTEMGGREVGREGRDEKTDGWVGGMGMKRIVVGYVWWWSDRERLEQG